MITASWPESAALVIADSHRASEIVARIRAMVRKAPPHKEWIDINDALESAIALAHAEASKHRIELLSRLSEDIPPICVDKIQIQQVVLNLVVNAIEAMRGPVGEDEGLRKLIVSSERYDSQAVRSGCETRVPVYRLSASTKSSKRSTRLNPKVSGWGSQ